MLLQEVLKLNCILINDYEPNTEDNKLHFQSASNDWFRFLISLFNTPTLTNHSRTFHIGTEPPNSWHSWIQYVLSFQSISQSNQRYNIVWAKARAFIRNHFMLRRFTLRDFSILDSLE